MGVNNHVHMAMLSVKNDNQIQLRNRNNFKDVINRISWELKRKQIFFFFNYETCARKFYKSLKILAFETR